MEHMTDKKVWSITGASRGMGGDIGKAALALAEQKVADLQQQIDPYRDLATSLAIEAA